MEGSAKFCVNLDPQTRQELEDITSKGSAPARKVRRARVLLLSDQHHPLGRYTDQQISGILNIHVNSVARIRKEFVASGQQATVNRKVRATPAIAPKLDGAKEAQLFAICCSQPPGGRKDWTMNLLANELVGRKIVTSICAETVRVTLKKIRSSRG